MENCRKLAVILSSAQPTCEFSLEDEEGKFLTVPSAEPGTDDDHPPLEPSESGEEHSDQKIDALKAENQTLHDRVSHLESKLEEEKMRFRESWQTNCQCLAEYDAVISAKDSEIEELKRRLSTLRAPSETHSEAVTSGSAYHSEEPT